jgi:hypothetical protein
MGNPVGFLELERVELGYENPKKRVTHHREFVRYLSPEKAKKTSWKMYGLWNTIL